MQSKEITVTLAACAMFFLATDARWTSEGREFAFSFTPIFNWTAAGQPSICQLVVTSRQVGIVRVQADAVALDQTYSVSPNMRTIINLGTALRPSGVGYEKKAVYVTSDVDVALFAFSSVTPVGTSGGQQSGYLVYPPVNGDDYVLLSRNESHSDVAPHSYYTVVALEDDTAVDVFEPASGGGYEFVYTIFLDRGESFCNVSQHGGDMTGIKLSSFKRISVNAGHANLYLSFEPQWRTQAIGSTIFPSFQLGNEYLIPGIAGMDTFACLIRVVAVRPGDTVVTHQGYMMVIRQGQFAEFRRSDQSVPSLLTCSKSCSVAVYTYQDNVGGYGGTMQLSILPSNTFTTTGLFFSTADADDRTRHFVSIVVLGTDVSNVTIDGMTPAMTWVTVAGTVLTYSHASMSLTEGAHVISSTRPVMAYSYGHFLADNRGMSYGYPAGFSYGCGGSTGIPPCIAFSTGLTGPQGQGLVKYDRVVINDGDGYDSATSSFRAPSDDYYWLHVSSSSEARTSTDVFSVGATRIGRLVQSSAVNDGTDTVSRDDIFLLRRECGSFLTLTALPVFSDMYLQTSMVGFSIFSVTAQPSPTVFALALSQHTICANTARVTFDIVLADTDGGWLPASSEYRAPISGTYVMSLKVGSQPGQPLAVGLYYFQQLITSVQLTSTNHEYETESQLTAISLDAGQSVYVGCFLVANSFLHGSPDYQTMLTGFHYQATPLPLVWCVVTDAPLIGPVDPVRFPIVLLNRGNGWNSLAQQYEVLQTATYYLHITLGTSARQPARLELLVNNVVQTIVMNADTAHDGVKTRSRAVMLRLSRDDVIRIRLPTGFAVYGDSSRITLFTGFLLYA